MIEDFSYIILEDLSLFNDNHHQWLMEDYYLESAAEKRPNVLALFSQKPKAQADWFTWIKETSNSFSSKLVNLEFDAIEKIHNPEIKSLLVEA